MSGAKNPPGGYLREVMILLARASGGHVREAKLQKMMYLLSYPLDGIGRGHYETSDRGPRSAAVEAEKASLESAGVLRCEGGRAGLTARGAEAAEDAAGRAAPRTLAVIRTYADMFGDVDDDELSAYVYLACTETARSAECARLQPRMEPLIMSLLRKEKISAQRAAELLGQSYLSILRKAGDAGIRPLGA